MSFDTREDNRDFAEAQGFGFPLLSDVDRVVGADYQVLRPPDDQFAQFPLRVSYLIDSVGVIRRTYSVADVHAHAEQVLADLAQLQSAA